MTVSTEVSREEYSGNGVTTDFDYRFRVFTAENIRVEVVDPQGQIAALTLNADFTVTGAGSRAGGKVRLKKPLGKDWRISISRHLPITQETDLRNQGNFFPEVHEDVFDKLTMLIQQVFGKFGLELRKPSWLANYFDAKQQRIAYLALPVDEQDAATKGYADTLDAKTNRHVEELDAKTNQNVEALNSATNTRVTELDKATNERVGQLHADISNRALRTPEGAIAPIPPVALRAGKLLSFDALGAPIAALPSTGSAAEVLTELAKPDGATKIGSQQPGGKSETVQQALTNIHKEADKKFDKTGGTVNGPLTVEGNAKFTGTDYLDKSGVITDKKNTVRETNGLRIRGIEGQRADLRYWEKIGQGASLKLNVISGKSNGEFDFRQNGEFRANGGAQFGGNIHVSWGGRTATFHENGDVAGPIWGGPLSAWLNNQLQNRTRTQVDGGRGGWWYKDESTGFIFQGGVVERGGNKTRVNFPLRYQRECFGVQLTYFDGAMADTISVADIENSGFNAWMRAIGVKACWTAVGV